MSNPVAEPLPEYTAHQTRLALINVLMVGLEELQKQCTKYLPQEPAESNQAWKLRVQRSIDFTPFFERTLDKMKGEVFTKDVALGDDVPAEIKTLCENIDLQGRNESRFAQEVFQAALKDGVTHILVDYPQADGLSTLADEKAAGVRPYWVHIPADRLIGWQHAMINGKQVLTQIRIKECATRTDPDNPYVAVEVDRIRVMTLGELREDGSRGPVTFEIWEEQEEVKGGKAWVKINEGAITLDFIPLVTVQFGKAMSIMTAKPPLEGVATLNLSHYQLYSDYKQTLHQMVPIWFAKGVQDSQGRLLGEEGSEVTMGAGRIISSANPDSALEGITLKSEPAEAMLAELHNIEDKIAIFGLTLMLPKGGQITATQAGQDKGENDSALKGWAMLLKDCLELALQYTAAWLKTEKGGSVTVNTDFRAISGIDIQWLTQALIAGKLPFEVWLSEMQRRGVLQDHWDPVEVAAMLENELRAAGSANFGGLAANLLRRPAAGTLPAAA